MGYIFAFFKDAKRVVAAVGIPYIRYITPQLRA
jgi:hypothetical protein